MATADIIRYGMIAVGAVIMLLSFWFHAVQKMTADLAVVWEFLGLILIVIGAVPALSAWTVRISAGTGLALFCLGVVCAMGAFHFSLMVSRMQMKNQELAMQISLLMEENERVRGQLAQSAALSASGR